MFGVLLCVVESSFSLLAEYDLVEEATQGGRRGIEDGEEGGVLGEEAGEGVFGRVFDLFALVTGDYVDEHLAGLLEGE